MKAEHNKVETVERKPELRGQHQDLIRVAVVEERLSDGSKVYNVQIGDSGEHYEIYCRNQIAAINLKTKIDDAILEAV